MRAGSWERTLGVEKQNTNDAMQNACCIARRKLGIQTRVRPVVSRAHPLDLEFSYFTSARNGYVPSNSGLPFAASCIN
jgi:hypothetical protein